MGLKTLASATCIAMMLGAGAAGASPLAPEAAQIWSVDRATTAILVEDHRAPLVEIRLVFPAGTWSPWTQRVRYLPEAFSLQLMDPGGKLRARADRMGADVVLATDQRMSQLSLGCRKADLDSVVELARAILANRDFDRREILQRNVQTDMAWSLAQKNPQRVLAKTVSRELFVADDPRRWPLEQPLHTPAELSRLLAARDTLVRLPGRVIGMAGDLTRREAERIVVRLLPPALAMSPAPLAPALPPLVPRHRRTSTRIAALPGLTQAYLALARDCPGTDAADYPAFVIADHVLGGHFYSRLYQAMRHDSGDTYATGTSSGAEPAPGAYSIWTYTRTANTANAERKLLEVVRVLHDRGITDRERADAVGYMRGQRLFAMVYPGKVLDGVIRDHSRGLPRDYRSRLLARETSLSLAQINDFIRRFYDPASFTLVQVMKK